MTAQTTRPADAPPSWVDRLPQKFQGFARLSRVDRPIGIWLLAIPCWMGLAFGALDEGWQPLNLFYGILFAIGSIAMRGAGCTINDLADQDLDKQVARTAERPLPSGAVTRTEAYLWLAVQLLVGLAVWLFLPLDAKIVAMLSMPLVIAYPFMKRITWWPQAWLGMTFNWGFPVGYLTAGGNDLLWPVLFYLGLIAWTIGYDTIYARQDVEDDALVGIKSTARLFGDHTIPAVAGIYGLCALLIGLALSYGGPRVPGVMITLAFLCHLVWQLVMLKSKGDGVALFIFKSNRDAGLLIVFGVVVTVALMNLG
ncbi:4-hydroxybenzoate octaprenyltransferase [Ponticaulis sp.]|uniref:4-hydroxybenzoate octaprenyltransferase n=1 Tax=Ponticaulis sp. TaxID=2020902 RepID=UPI000B62F3DA|nr:4-hydroxybenzoate octaprenyltransferase [Ponticaulis sp.]MAI88919.1 4-hydroxybenzoate octaprenyltransferase [Ponticaulis sp.]OUY01607.1 MAG: 4-hydroxybenzoate polyprenyltransferase [Hyphomonadaceae bacterium TMED5]|tara:strand:- start:40349 stop:41281 length:933 start_codon:yes stop_codon:yes gene_type:complete